MNKQIDQPTMQRLVLAKYLFSQGKQQLSHQAKLSANLAILNFHDATEILMVALANHNGIDIKKEKLLPALIAEINKIIEKSGKKIQDVGFDQLNQARIRIKHYGEMVEFEKIPEISFRVEEMLTENVKNLLGINFSEIRISLLIKDEKIKEHLVIAEEALNSDDFKTFLTEIALSFSYVKEMAQKLNWGGLSRLSQHDLQLPFLVDRDPLYDTLRRTLNTSFRKVNEQFDFIRDALIMLSYGVTLHDYFFFNALTPYVYIMMDGERRLLFSDLNMYQHEWNLNKLNMGFLFDFVLNTALRVEVIQRKLISKFDAVKRKLKIESDEAPIYSETDVKGIVIKKFLKGEILEEEMPVPLDFEKKWFNVKITERLTIDNMVYTSGYVKREDVSLVESDLEL